ncbi:MAG: class I SAM-dependent methyltransferase [Deltaproteobacteria bacterium]|nr:class I SAM-dependent methyltransferase [Deltaproteobacteria bacterium]
MKSHHGPSLFELAHQALSSVERGYDLLAPKFDHTPYCTPEPVLVGAFSDLFVPHSVPRAIDVACGTGVALAQLAPYVRDDLVGLDLSSAMLAQARVRLEALPMRAKLSLIHEDILSAPAHLTGFDVVTCFGAFGHIAERDEEHFVAAIHQLLRPGGVFVFVTAERAPTMAQRSFWLSHGFNLAMRVRNALIRPPFVMYYLTFLLPRATQILEAQGFEVHVSRGRFAAPFDHLVRVTATRR